MEKKVSSEKTKYMTNQKRAPRHLITRHGEIRKTETFPYLGETIQHNSQDKAANKIRYNKLTKQHVLTIEYAKNKHKY